MGLPAIRTVDRLVALAIVLTIALVAGCQQQEAQDPGENLTVTHDSLVAAESRSAAAPRIIKEEEAAASHILITHRDSRGVSPVADRGRSEAEDLARRIHVLLRTNRAHFHDLARKYSDDETTRERGGYIGIFARGEMVRPFEKAVLETEIGATHGVIETEYGFHIIRREPVRRHRMHHILVAWRDAMKVRPGVKRTREEARTRADRLQKLAVARPAETCALAQRYSDDHNNRASCGDLGWLEPGRLSLEIDEVIFRLRPGQVSEVIESPYGFHVFWRE